MPSSPTLRIPSFESRSNAPKILLASAYLLFGSPAAAQEVEQLGELSIEELTELEVRSAAKRAQPLGQAPTSIYVITADDIVHSPATSLPEVLRQAPNLTVQRVDARQYAISARGFNGYVNANKLLVLIDGRSVYTPLHSGVFWELHSPLLEDLAQIEVISGPGGTLFGPNAVNGVVNVASKDARETLGGLVRATAGANERTGAVRYGIPIGQSGGLRVYATGFDRENMPAGAAADSDDRFKAIQAGFRADFGTGDGQFTVQGAVMESDTGGLAGDGDSSRNLLARWTHGLGTGSSLQIQAYYDAYTRKFVLIKDSLQTFDVEAQANLSTGRHKLVAGAGIRTTKDQFINNLNGFVLSPERRRLWVFHAYVQDEFALTPNISLTAGIKAERSSFSGVELLPSIRLAWNPAQHHLLWGAVSRAVRTPSRIDRELIFPSILLPAPEFRSEKLVAFEAGYRGQIATATALSLSFFYNVYDDLRTTAFTPTTLFPAQLQNGMEGESYGLEAWLMHQLASWWRLNLGFSALQEDFRLKPGRNDLSNLGSAGANPDYQLLFRSQLDLAQSVRFDLQARLVDDLGQHGPKGYVEADARLGWALSDRLELFIAGNNLVHRAHRETNDGSRGQAIERSIYAGTRIRL